MALCVLQKWQGVLLGHGSFAGKSAAKKNTRNKLNMVV